MHYKTYGLTSVFAAPGFKTSTDSVLEVDPARIEGLTLEMWRDRVISGLGGDKLPLASPQPTPTSGATPRAAGVSTSR